ARDAPCLWCDGHRHHRQSQPELQGPDPARRDPHAPRYRERGGPHRGQHLPGRAHLRSAALQPPDSGLRAVPRAAARVVYVRLEHPPRRGGHGRRGRKCGGRDPPRPRAGAVNTDHTRRSYDCIVVGGGHNGLVCAAYLARKGRSVLVLEAAEQVGGAAVTRQFAPGFHVSSCAHLLHLMPARILSELALATHGLKFAAQRLPTVALSADGRPLILGTGHEGDLAARSPADTVAYQDWQRLLARLAATLHPLLAAVPPRLGTAAWRERLALLNLGWRVRRLGRRDMRE